ncbi:MAG: zinc metallopeptidase [Defluviitaleaceae bacterium]|nr:zinc metallopeptidase [Defluviitaleaceae bacterium]
MFMMFDPLFIALVLPALAFTLIAQFMVKGRFNKYSKVRTQNGITGAQAAEQILREAGITDVRIEQTHGHLSDHFDPRGNVIRLSESVYGAATVAAVGVAAHEAGHAVQYARGYFPMKVRAAIIPVTNFGSRAAMPLIFIGILLGAASEATGPNVGMMLLNAGILLFSTVVVFQLVTLPVEFNASRRALVAINNNSMLTPQERVGSRKVLTAAALTYVAALALSIAQLLRFLAMARRR